MNKDEISALQRNSNGDHPGLRCAGAERFHLPCWMFSAQVLVSAKARPEELDTVFMGLICNGVNTRSKLAGALGVESDSFIFQHLDMLVDRWFVWQPDGDKYALTEQGERFHNGDFKEERSKKEHCFVVWDCITKAMLAEEQPYVDASQKGGKMFLRHPHFPLEKETRDIVTEHFLQNAHERKMTFDDFIRKPPFIEKVYDKREYVALFYIPKDEHGGSRIEKIEIRRRGDANLFVLCKELTEAIESSVYWHEQLEKLYRPNRNA